MDLWLTVRPSGEFSRLCEVVETGSDYTGSVPTVRGWADALIKLHTQGARRLGPVAIAEPVGAFLLNSTDGNAEAASVMVATERCVVGRPDGLAGLFRPSEWRHAKHALTENGWGQTHIEELITPTTQDGCAGYVDPHATAAYVASLEQGLQLGLLRYFESDLDRWVGSWRALSSFHDEGGVPRDHVIVVPRDAVIAARLADGQEVVIQ